MNRTRSERGLTIVELLVCMVIIGVIAGLSVPVGFRTIGKARRAQMFVQLRALGEDQVVHQRDKGTFYPAGGTSSSAFLPTDPITMEGSSRVIPGNERCYAYFILRLEPTYDVPLVFSYAQTSLNNDLDNDPYPDMWVKIGTDAPRLYFDDVTNTQKMTIDGAPI